MCIQSAKGSPMVGPVNGVVKSIPLQGHMAGMVNNSDDIVATAGPNLLPCPR